MVIAGSFVISSNELVSVIVRLVYPGILGRSGMVRRYLSSLCLKLSVLQSVLFLMSSGMLLNRFGLHIMNLPSLIVLIAQLTCDSILGILQSSLSLRYIGFLFWVGLFPSIILQIYMNLCLSILLSCDLVWVFWVCPSSITMITTWLATPSPLNNGGRRWLNH